MLKKNAFIHTLAKKKKRLRFFQPNPCKCSIMCLQNKRHCCRLGCPWGPQGNLVYFTGWKTQLPSDWFQNYRLNRDLSLVHLTEQLQGSANNRNPADLISPTPSCISVIINTDPPATGHCLLLVPPSPVWSQTLTWSPNVQFVELFKAARGRNEPAVHIALTGTPQSNITRQSLMCKNHVGTCSC